MENGIIKLRLDLIRMLELSKDIGQIEMSMLYVGDQFNVVYDIERLDRLRKRLTELTDELNELRKKWL